MGQQRLNQKKTAVPTRPQPTKTTSKSPVHPVEELQAAIGNREMGRLMETNRLPHPSSPFPKLQGELPLLGGMPVSQGTIQRQPLFRGLSQELNAEKGTLVLPETGAVVQRKLTLGTPGDMYEQEADRVARQVVDEIHSSPFREQNSLSEEERKPAGGEAGRVQRQINVRSAGDAGGELSSEWEGQLQRAKSGGQPLSPSVKEPMEQAFGTDFGGVRVHTGAQADMLARLIQANAFTTGQDVFFRQGAYEPGSRRWEELLAHELTHVVQQDNAASLRTKRKKREEAVMSGVKYNEIRDNFSLNRKVLRCANDKGVKEQEKRRKKGIEELKELAIKIKVLRREEIENGMKLAIELMREMNVYNPILKVVESLYHTLSAEVLARESNSIHILTRVLAPEQIDREELGIESVSYGEPSIEKNLPNGLKARGSGMSDITRLYSYMRKFGGAGLQGFHKETQNRKEIIKKIIKKVRTDPRRNTAKKGNKLIRIVAVDSRVKAGKCLRSIGQKSEEKFSYFL